MECKICKSTTDLALTLKILNKYQVKYFQCLNCQFIQTETPYWLSEAYNDHAISAMDTGILARNLSLVATTSEIILKSFNLSGKFLDYGGGLGVFVRLMRDKGFDFYRYDSLCENIFARFFDIGAGIENIKDSYELITAMEVFEHLENPLLELEKLFKLTDTILFSTELVPLKINNLSEWWYLSPETGQHISFYTTNSFLEIASQFDARFYSNGSSIHILTKRKIKDPFRKLNGFTGKVKRKLKSVLCSTRNKNINNSLTWEDREYIRKMLKNSGINES